MAQRAGPSSREDDGKLNGTIETAAEEESTGEELRK